MRSHRTITSTVALLAVSLAARAGRGLGQLAAQRLRRPGAGQPGDPRRGAGRTGAAAAAAPRRRWLAGGGSRRSAGSTGRRRMLDAPARRRRAPWQRDAARSGAASGAARREQPPGAASGGARPERVRGCAVRDRRTPRALAAARPPPAGSETLGLSGYRPPLHAPGARLRWSSRACCTRRLRGAPAGGRHVQLKAMARRTRVTD